MENRAFIKVQYSTRPWDNRNWICAVLTINIFVRYLGDKLAELPAKFQSSVEYIDFNIPGLGTHMVLFWDVFVNSLWLMDATKACNLVNIGGLFPDGAKALPEPSSIRYLSSTVTIELNVDTHVSRMSRINPVILLFLDCCPLTLCILGLAVIINWVLTIGFISALRTCDLNLDCCKCLEICRASDSESVELPTRFKTQVNLGGKCVR